MNNIGHTNTSLDWMEENRRHNDTLNRMEESRRRLNDQMEQNRRRNDTFNWMEESRRRLNDRMEESQRRLSDQMEQNRRNSWEHRRGQEHGLSGVLVAILLIILVLGGVGALAQQSTEHTGTTSIALVKS